MNPRPVQVEPLENYELLVTFQNGERRIFDVKPLLCKPLYAALKNKAFSRLAKQTGCACIGTMRWICVRI